MWKRIWDNLYYADWLCWDNSDYILNFLPYQQILPKDFFPLKEWEPWEKGIAYSYRKLQIYVNVHLQVELMQSLFLGEH